MKPIWHKIRLGIESYDRISGCVRKELYHEVDDKTQQRIWDIKDAIDWYIRSKYGKTILPDDL